MYYEHHICVHCSITVTNFHQDFKICTLWWVDMHVNADQCWSMPNSVDQWWLIGIDQSWFLIGTDWHGMYWWRSYWIWVVLHCRLVVLSCDLHGSLLTQLMAKCFNMLMAWGNIFRFGDLDLWPMTLSRHRRVQNSVPLGHMVHPWECSA